MKGYTITVINNLLSVYRFMISEIRKTHSGIMF